MKMNNNTAPTNERPKSDWWASYQQAAKASDESLKVSWQESVSRGIESKQH